MTYIINNINDINTINELISHDKNIKISIYGYNKKFLDVADYIYEIDYIESKNVKNLIHFKNLKSINILYGPISEHIDIISNLNLNNLGLESSDINNNDIIKLNNINVLRLQACNYITDLSPLEDVETLIVDQCINIEKFPSFKNIKKLGISNNEYITDLSSLAHLEKLVIKYCYNITNESSVKDIPFLEITYCEWCIDNVCSKCIENSSILSL